MQSRHITVHNYYLMFNISHGKTFCQQSLSVEFGRVKELAQQGAQLIAEVENGVQAPSCCSFC